MKVPFTALIIVFDRTAEVTHTRFSINEQTLLTKLGGAVSSGRTLLWILVSILGGIQVILHSFSIFSGSVQAEEHLQEIWTNQGDF